MLALPSFIIYPLWDQFESLIPEPIDDHPLGCHRPRFPDRVVFDKLVQVLVLGAAYERIADTGCSATTIRRRRDEWITAGVFARLEQICLEAYDKILGLELDDVTFDGCIVKAPCVGDAAGKSPVYRGKQGTKRSLLTDAGGIPLGCVSAPANRHDSVFLRPTLEYLGRFESRFGVGLPDSLEDAGLSFIVGSRTSKAPKELEEHFGRRGNAIADGETVDLTRPMGQGRDRRDRRVVWHYKWERAQRDRRTLNAQIDRAQRVADRDEPLKKQRFVKVTGQNVALDEASIERARQSAGYKGYVTNIDPKIMDGHAVVAVWDAFRVARF